MVTWNIGCGVGLTRGLVTVFEAVSEAVNEADIEAVRPPGPPRVTRFTSGKLFVFS